MRIEWIPLAKLGVDRTLQRELHEGWCQKAAENFDAGAIGTLTVSQRVGGDMVLLDGQQRAQILRLAFPKDWQRQEVACVVHRGLSYSEEASLFRRLNFRRAVRYNHDWKLRVISGETVAVAVTALLAEFGLKVSDRAGPKTIRAARALHRIYTYGGGPNDKALRDVLGVVIAAWGHDVDSFDGMIIEGLGRLMLRDAASIDFDSLSRGLAKSGTPSKLIGSARTAAKLHHKTPAHALAGVVADIYNRRRKSGTLDGWW